jgi:hypothetical protein
VPAAAVSRLPTRLQDPLQAAPLVSAAAALVLSMLGASDGNYYQVGPIHVQAT